MRELWRLDQDGAINWTITPFVSGEFLVLLSRAGSVSLVNRDTGDQVRSARPKAAPFVAFSVRGSLLLVYPVRHGIVSLHPQSLDVRASAAPPEDCIFDHPRCRVGDSLVCLLSPAGCHVTQNPGTLLGLSPDLQERWRQRSRAPVSSLLELNDSHFVASHQSNALVDVYTVCDGHWVGALGELGGRAERSYRGTNTTYLWGRGSGVALVDSRTLAMVRTSVPPPNGVATDSDRAYLSYRGRLATYDLSLAEHLGDLDCNDPRRDSDLQGHACIVGDMVCVGSNNCFLWCFNKHTGELVEKIEYPDFVSAPPVLDGNRLYVCCLNGTVYCYDVSEYLR